MLLAVAGTSGYRRVLGLDTTDPAALLRATGGRPPSEPVLVLAPQHLAQLAAEQAHVRLAADSRARVSVLPLAHHALTLALIGEAVHEQLSGPDPRDPSDAVRLVHRLAARSRSLVWYPRLWGLAEPAVGIGQALRAMIGPGGFYRELGGPAAVHPAKGACPFTAADTVHHLAPAPAPLADQLGGARAVPVELDVEPAPYWARTSVELTVLAAAAVPAGDGTRCDSCAASRVDGVCPFCGHGPVNLAEPTLPKAAAREGDQADAGRPVLAASALVGSSAGAPQPSEGDAA
jgi:hypothetical protein